MKFKARFSFEELCKRMEESKLSSQRILSEGGYRDVIFSQDENLGGNENHFYLPRPLIYTHGGVRLVCRWQIDETDAIAYLTVSFEELILDSLDMECWSKMTWNGSRGGEVAGIAPQLEAFFLAQWGVLGPYAEKVPIMEAKARREAIMAAQASQEE